MKREVVVLLENIRLVCGREYKLLTTDELCKMSGDGVTPDETFARLKRLAAAGYLDIRYIGDGEVLLKPLDKDFSEDEDRETSRLSLAGKDNNVRLIVFCAVASFLGGAAGAALALLIGALC